jgi:hypothetical protein
MVCQTTYISIAYYLMVSNIFYGCYLVIRMNSRSNDQARGCRGRKKSAFAG